MRIRELRLIRYGKFTDRALSLPFADCDIHLIVGPNEAGKSTVRTAIGDWLFGIPTRTPLAFLHPMPELRIGGVIERRSADGAAGQELAFERTKGNKNTLRTPQNAPLPDGVLQPWLGGLQAQSFNRMVALDHHTLVQGGAGILSASDDIGRMLFQSASGMEVLGEALLQLQNEADSLWAPRKAASRVYYQNLEAYEAANAAFKQATLRTRDWKAHDERLRATGARLAEARARELDLRQQISRLERIRRVRPLLLELDAAVLRQSELLAAGGDGALFEAGTAEAFAVATGELAGAEAAIRRWEGEVRELRAGLSAISVDRDILALREDITELNEQRQQFRAHRSDLVKRTEELRLEWQRVQELVRGLGWSADDEEAIRKRLPSASLRLRLTALLRDRAVHALDLKAAQASLLEHQDQIQQAKDALLDLTGGAVDPDLVLAVEQATRLGDHESFMREGQEEIDGLTARIEAALAAMGPWPCSIESLPTMLAPEPGDVQSLLEQHRADAAEEKTYRDALVVNSGELAQLAHDLDQFLLGFQPIARAQILEARQARDQSWQAMKEAPQSLLDRAERFELQIARADSLADQRLDQARDEAEHRSKADRLEQKRRERINLEERIAVVLRRMELRSAQWAALSSACGLPSLPLEMAQNWLQGRRDVLDLLLQRSLAARRRDAQAARAEDLRDRLWSRLPNAVRDAPAPELALCLQQARACLTRADQEQGQRKVLEQQILQGRSGLPKLEREFESAQQAWKIWTQSWEAAVDLAGYGSESTVETIASELEQMGELERLLDRIRSIRSERIDTMQADLDGFQASAEGLRAKIGSDLQGGTPEELALDFAKRLQLAQKAEEASALLLARLNRAESEQTGAQSTRQAVLARLAPWMATAGVQELSALRRAIEASEERRAVEGRILRVEQELYRAADGIPVDVLRQQCEDLGADALKAELDRLARDAQDAVAAIASLGDTFGAQRTAFDALEGGAHAARAEMQRQEALAAMADSAERYLRLQTAVRLLKWSIEKFRVARQGPMLSKASKLFKELTLHAFSRLLVDAEGDPPRLFGIRPNGEQVDVTGMSEGTRDQLYLALRLAALELQAEQGFHLPLIADDLFINFDDGRTVAGLKVLAEVSRSTQVVLMTHHDHLMKLAEQTLGDRLNRIML